MPLKGKAKKDYQRDYMRKHRGTKTPRVGLTGSNNSGLTNPIRSNKGLTTSEGSKNTFRPCPKPVGKLRLEKAGLKVQGNRVSLALQSKSSPLKDVLNSRIPKFDKAIHKQGDKVRIAGPTGKLVEVVVAEVDGDGNPIPEFT